MENTNKLMVKNHNSGEGVTETQKKREILLFASSVIKPTLWFTNSILDKSGLATDEELEELDRLTRKTAGFKQRAWEIDKQISEILTSIGSREAEE